MFLRRIPVPLGVRLYYPRVWWAWVALSVGFASYAQLGSHQGTLSGALLGWLWNAGLVWGMGSACQVILWLFDYLAAS